MKQIKTFSLAFTYVGCFLGAGFISGQELWQFFGAFGNWGYVGFALAALLFGFFRALGNVYTGFDFLQRLNLPSNVYNMLPYIFSLIVLILTSKNSRAPKAEGIPYDKGQR